MSVKELVTSFEIGRSIPISEERKITRDAKRRKIVNKREIKKIFYGL